MTDTEFQTAIIERLARIETTLTNAKENREHNLERIHKYEDAITDKIERMEDDCPKYRATIIEKIDTLDKTCTDKINKTNMSVMKLILMLTASGVLSGSTVAGILTIIGV